MLNKVVDMGERKPLELNIKFWEDFKRIRD
jgi:hypothetical protein